MKRVYSEPNPVLIYQIKGLLEGQGIRVILKNELLSGAAGELPPTEVWPELWVIDDEDQRPAERIVEDFMQTVRGSPQDWVCRHCGGNIEGQFNMCWSCGTARN